ncbi:MAG: GNAT family N-acetyltransferase [Rhodobacter sp.]|uniref:GNAT family N-acyltransferase n=1 Tax=Pararhodobacter sp. TaxID=2127056 RepID=UPI001DF6302C|nr:GNAT family N-acyltransferase [Pararhodobacter sp.]MCB1344816.1 GNAT family N-acetyltransferase [Paracoccaceae bacterium]MCC0074053.1 GNAT family N-acetyltransferase [Rhodobacter sp.]HPD91845.1 GNAT family N-acyltransferase [Pararhodobacter sp.]
MRPPDTDPDSPFGPPIVRGGWSVRLATPEDMPAILLLRARAFRGGSEDGDAHDAASLHLWVGTPGQGPRATVRLRVHPDGAALLGGYAAGHYDLRALAASGGVTLELGRLCTAGAGAATDSATGAGGDLLRLVWAGVARLVQRSGAARLVGCTSFPTTDTAALAPAWAYLAARAAAPAERRPQRKAPETHPFPPASGSVDAAAVALLPPLLRAYLAMGGWVSDHAVVDRDLGTCHVFTCVEVDRLPPARRRAVEALAAG